MPVLGEMVLKQEPDARHSLFTENLNDSRAWSQKADMYCVGGWFLMACWIKLWTLIMINLLTGNHLTERYVQSINSVLCNINHFTSRICIA